MRHMLRRLIHAIVLCALALPAHALTLIRDAELEYALGELARPVLTAAGLSPGQVRIMVVNDDQLNAFVADTRHIFLNAGLIRRMTTPEMLQAVIAHEAAHITNGHIARRAANARNARSAAGLGLVLSAVVAASGNSNAAAGIAAGTNSSAQRVFFSHTRSEESAADQSSARILARAGIDPQAMVDVQEIFRGQEVLSVSRQDPYSRTHPMNAERLRAARTYAAAYQARAIDQSETAYWYARARGKLDAWLGNPTETLRRLHGAAETDVVLMQRAVANLRLPDYDAAVAQVNRLVTLNPNDAYAHELKGQILFESGNYTAAEAAYGHAVELRPRHPLILSGYGQAMLAQDSDAKTRAAIEILERAYSLDPRQPRLLRDLAVAYARTGNNGMASLMTAERYAMIGRMSDAALHAQRAEDQLPRGSVGWNRAQDVLVAANRAN